MCPLKRKDTLKNIDKLKSSIHMFNKPSINNSIMEAEPAKIFIEPSETDSDGAPSEVPLGKSEKTSLTPKSPRTGHFGFFKEVIRSRNDDHQ